MKSERVKSAWARGDRAALVRMGRAGGKATAQIRKQEQSRRELLAEDAQIRAEQEEYQRLLETNELNVPVDPDEAPDE